MDIQGIAQGIARKYKTTDPFRIARDRHVIIRYVPLGMVMGYHCYGYRQRFIIINQELGGHEARFVCAHELGHVILHPATNTSFLTRFTFANGARIERQANTFAVTLLCYGIEPVDGFTVRETAAVYGIPREYADMLQKCLFA